MKRSLKIIFTISFIFNGLFLGFVGGRVYREMNEVRPWDETKEALAPETRRLLKETFEGKKNEIMPLFEEARAEKEAMKAIMTASDFDEEAYEKLSEGLRELNGKFMSHRLSTIKAIFSQLPQEERKKMASHTVERMLGNPPRHHMERKYGRGRQHFDSQRFDKKGAIDHVPGREAFDARGGEETPAESRD